MTPLARRITLAELIDRLDADGIDAVEGECRAARETFSSPLTVRDYSEFEDVLFAYYAHCFQIKWGSLLTERLGVWSLIGWPDAFKCLGGWKGINAASNNAVHCREGGMIGVIDRWTECMIRHAIDSHIDCIVMTHVPGSDRDVWHPLAKEFLNRYGGFLFPDEEVRTFITWYDDFLALLRTFAVKRRAIRNQMAGIADNQKPAETQQ